MWISLIHRTVITILNTIKIQFKKISEIESKRCIICIFQAAALELKDNLAAGTVTWPYPTARYHPYDTFAGYSFNG